MNKAFLTGFYKKAQANGLSFDEANYLLKRAEGFGNYVMKDYMQSPDFKPMAQVATGAGELTGGAGAVGGAALGGAGGYGLASLLTSQHEGESPEQYHARKSRNELLSSGLLGILGAGVGGAMGDGLGGATGAGVGLAGLAGHINKNTSFLQ